LCERFARMTEYTKILYGALGPLSAFREPLAVYAIFVTNWPNFDQLADQLAKIRPTGLFSFSITWPVWILMLLHGGGSTNHARGWLARGLGLGRLPLTAKPDINLRSASTA
jgi:hypothetical protein